jgi:hypothetical protein
VPNFWWTVAPRQAFLRVLQFSHLSIMPPMLHTDLHINIALIRRTSGQSLGTFRAMLFQISGDHWTGKYFDIVSNTVHEPPAFNTLALLTVIQ